METDAERQLSLIADARVRAADHLVTPWWYHLSLGVLMSGLVLANGLGFGTWWFAVVVALVLAGEAMLVSAYRRVMGVWTTTGEIVPRWVILVGFGVAIALVGAAVGVRLWTGLLWPVWVLAAAMFVYMVVLGRWMDVVWRKRLRTAE